MIKKLLKYVLAPIILATGIFFVRPDIKHEQPLTQGPLLGADSTISNLTELSTVHNSDILPIVDLSGTPTTKKITRANLFAGYLPLTGGTLTGNLIGTNASISSSVEVAGYASSSLFLGSAFTGVGTCTSSSFLHWASGVFSCGVPANSTFSGLDFGVIGGSQIKITSISFEPNAFNISNTASQGNVYIDYVNGPASRSLANTWSALQTFSASPLSIQGANASISGAFGLGTSNTLSEQSSLKFIDWQTKGTEYTLSRIKAPKSTPYEATLALLVDVDGNNAGINEEFIDFYNENYSDSHQSGIRGIKTGTGRLKEFKIGHWDSVTTKNAGDNTIFYPYGGVSMLNELNVAIGTTTTASTAYSRFGTGTTGRGLNAGNDVLISDALEVNGSTWLDGVASVAGTFEAAGTMKTEVIEGSLNDDVFVQALNGTAYYYVDTNYLEMLAPTIVQIGHIDITGAASISSTIESIDTSAVTHLKLDGANSTTSPSIAAADDADTGFSFGGSGALNTLYLVTGGVSRLSIRDSGASLSSGLEVSGLASVSASSGLLITSNGLPSPQQALHVYTPSATVARFAVQSNTTFMSFGADTGSGPFYMWNSAGSQPLRFATGSDTSGTGFALKASMSTNGDFELKGYASSSKQFGKTWTTAAGTPNSICQNATTGEITVNAALTCTVSDEEQKNGFKSLELDALKILSKITPAQFYYKDNLNRLRYGFGAQSLQEIDPRLADGYDSQGIARSIDIPALIALNTKGIQELAERDGVQSQPDGFHWQNYIGLLGLLGLLGLKNKLK